MMSGIGFIYRRWSRLWGWYLSNPVRATIFATTVQQVICDHRMQRWQSGCRSIWIGITICWSSMRIPRMWGPVEMVKCIKLPTWYHGDAACTHPHKGLGSLHGMSPNSFVSRAARNLSRMLATTDELQIVTCTSHTS